MELSYDWLNLRERECEAVDTHDNHSDTQVSKVKKDEYNI